MAKRKKRVRVEGDSAFFDVNVNFTIEHDLQGLLRNLVNIEYHDKAWAADGSPLIPATQEDEQYSKAHHQIGISHRRSIPVKFNLKTGELTLVPVQDGTGA